MAGHESGTVEVSGRQEREARFLKGLRGMAESGPEGHRSFTEIVGEHLDVEINQNSLLLQDEEATRALAALMARDGIWSRPGPLPAFVGWCPPGLDVGMGRGVAVSADVLLSAGHLDPGPFIEVDGSPVGFESRRLPGYVGPGHFKQDLRVIVLDHPVLSRRAAPVSTDEWPTGQDPTEVIVASTRGPHGCFSSLILWNPPEQCGGQPLRHWDRDTEFVVGAPVAKLRFDRPRGFPRVGDSGAGVYLEVGDEWKLAGIVSRNVIQSGNRGCGAIVVRVDKYREAIDEIVADLGGEPIQW